MGLGGGDLMPSWHLVWVGGPELVVDGVDDWPGVGGLEFVTGVGGEWAWWWMDFVVVVVVVDGWLAEQSIWPPW